MKITILGCGTPTPVPEAYGSSWVVEAAGQKLLFDCGPATTHKLVKAGIAEQNMISISAGQDAERVRPFVHTGVH